MTMNIVPLERRSLTYGRRSDGTRGKITHYPACAATKRTGQCKGIVFSNRTGGYVRINGESVPLCVRHLAIAIQRGMSQ